MDPTPHTDPREPVTVRLRSTTADVLDQLGRDTGTDRSKVARALIGAALASPTALRSARTMLEGNAL